MKWIIRVNTRSGEIIKQEASSEEMRWGGRLLVSKFLLCEVPPTCDPLGRYNKLIIAPGLLGDTSITTTGKFSVGGKSPLTGGVKESDVGGEAGRQLARLGIKALLLEDLPDTPHTNVLTITARAMTLSAMPELKGKWVRETFQALRNRFGPNAAIMCVGPAGEMKLLSAGVAVTDAQDIQLRKAARGGLGAVMGSKGIKAIVIDDTGAPPPPVFDQALLRDTSKEFVQMILADPKTENRHKYGTPAILMAANALGLLTTRNFSVGQFEHAEAISGERVAEVIEERSGGLRGLDDFGGLCKAAPVFCGLMGITLFASLGLPGLNGFVSEFLIFKGTLPLAGWAAAISTLGLLITAIFLLTILQRVFNGPLQNRWAGWKDLTKGEKLTLAPVIALIFVLGICPQILISVANPAALAMLKLF